MKTLLVCAEDLLPEHVGESYDDVLVVDELLTTLTIQEWALRVKDHIRKLWHEDEGDDKGVGVWMHGAAPFDAILINLQILMREEEGIRVELPYLEGREVPLTDEMKKALGE